MKKILFLASLFVITFLKAQQHNQTRPQYLEIEQQLRRSHQLIPNEPFAYFDTSLKRTMLYDPVHGVRDPMDKPDIKGASSQLLASTGVNPTNEFALTKDINASKDANPTNYTYSKPPTYALLNNVSYFTADNGINGTELWRSNGTAAGTFMLKDISPGEASSNIQDIVVSNNRLFFTVYSLVNGNELWTSNGTAGSTVLLKNLGGTNYPSALTDVNGKLFFVTGNYDNTQLWVSDGTSVGTQVVSNLLYNGEYSYNLTQLTAVNDLLFFTAYSQSKGYELYRSDGTRTGTYLVKDISNSLSYDEGPGQMTSYKNKLYFSANDGTGRVLWVSDGTAAHTNPAPGNNNVILQPAYYYNTKTFTISNNKLFFAGYTPASGWELCKYEGPASGVVLVKNITPGAGSTNVVTAQIVDVNNVVYLAYADSLLNVHLWKSIGNPPGTAQVANLGAIDFYNLYNANGKLLFNVRTDSAGYELWGSDGTTAGTGMVKDIYTGAVSSYPFNFTNCNGLVLFRANNETTGSELWKTDGTHSGTSLLKDINKTTTASSNPTQTISYNNLVLFTAYKPGTGGELWKSDGTATGTSIVKDIVPGESSGYPNFLTSKNNFAYFTYNISGNYGLYKTDGTAAGTSKIVQAANFINSYIVTENGTVFYFVYDNASMSYQLWKTGGTSTGNLLLRGHLYTNSQYYDYYNSFFHGISCIGNTIYFSALDNTANDGYELWKSDGTVAGTSMLKDIYPGFGSSSIVEMVVYNNKLYFNAFDGTEYSLWRCNGTPGGTTKLKAKNPSNFCISNNTLYFSAYNPTTGTELWKSDGTASGTKIVRDLYKGFNSSSPYNLTDVNGLLYFTATDSAHGLELWKSDGTSTNTKLVKDISPGLDYSYITYPTASSGKLFFLKDDVLWISDGTAAGTHQIDDLGLAGISSISYVKSSGDKLYFTGYTYKYGHELYAGNTSTLTFARSEMKAKEAPSGVFAAELVTNPVEDQIAVRITSKIRQAAQVVIADMAGRKLIANHLSLAAGVNMLNYNSSTWQHGLYMIMIESSDGSKATLKAVK